jgi:DUF1680 family protein
MTANLETSSILFVTGHRATGKSKVGELLNMYYDYATYDAGPALRARAGLYGEPGISTSLMNFAQCLSLSGGGTSCVGRSPTD